MNVLFFLTPKEDVEYLIDDFSIRQALEKMEYHKYSAIPVLDKEGHYVSTLTDGDLLWAIKQKQLSLKNSESILIKDIKVNRPNPSVKIDSDIKDLIHKSIRQNFIPVVDDNNFFIGIIRRQEIISFCYKQLTKNNII